VLRRVLAAGAVPVLVVVCAVWGTYLGRHGSDLDLASPPFVGHVDPRVGIGTPLAVLTALLVIGLKDRLVELPWRRLLLTVTAAAVLWSVSLALVDGPEGLRDPLLSRDQYLHDLPRVHDVTGFLHGFVSHITAHPGQVRWTTDVAGHPPGMMLLLAGMRELGLTGPWPAAVLCVVAGSSASAAALVTVQRLVDEGTARRAAPFLALLPAAVWVAVSADALFLGVSAWGIACLAGSSRRSALAGGLLMGAALVLTYGALTLGVLAATALLWRPRWSRIALAAAGPVVVLGLFALGGFWWWDGLQETLVRYGQGAGGYRPYGYFLVADLVVLSVAVGPAAVAGLTALHRRDRLGWLVAAGLLAVALADVSGKSKAEVERIWLLFVPWVAVATARLDRARLWLGVQALTGLVVQTVLVSKW
jgi:hypothetical protein